MNISSNRYRDKRNGSCADLHVEDSDLCEGVQPKTAQPFSAAITNFDSLPDAAHVRLPMVKLLYGCSSATVWRAVKSQSIPAPRRLAIRVTAWNVGDLRKALAKIK
ncbi:MAG: hypothetical protein ABIG70_08055 [Pseudomonadota bacterium]